MYISNNVILCKFFNIVYLRLCIRSTVNHLVSYIHIYICSLISLDLLRSTEDFIANIFIFVCSSLSYCGINCFDHFDLLVGLLSR